MKILLITGSFPPMRCGVGDYTAQLAAALARVPGLRVAVLTSASACQENADDRIEILPAMKRWALDEAWHLIRAIRHWAPDVVHVQYPTQGYGNGRLPSLIPIICFLLGRRVVQTWHEVDRSIPVALKTAAPTALIVVRPEFRKLLGPLQRSILALKNFTFIPNASNLPRINLSERERTDLRSRYLNGQSRLIVFYGFIHPPKRVELLFEIADPASDQLVIAGEFIESDAYRDRIAGMASAQPWVGKARIVGFLPAVEIARLLAVADAVLLPFQLGGGEWNTSIHGAVLQRAFVLTTSRTQNGYDRKRNIYYSKIDEVQEMKAALALYAGRRRELDSDIDRDEWQRISRMHGAVYCGVHSGQRVRAKGCR